jgi:hypothetical protein
LWVWEWVNEISVNCDFHVCGKHAAIMYGSRIVTYTAIGYISGARRMRKISAVRVAGVGAATIRSIARTFLRLVGYFICRLVTR